MIPILISEPAREPLTLDEARTWLRLDTRADDDLLACLIRAARVAVEQATRRALIAQSWRLRLDAWPREGLVRSPLAPILSIDAVRVFDASGAAQSVPSAGFRLDGGHAPRIVWDAPPPSPGRLHGGVEIDLTAGYGPAPGDVPEPLRQGLRLLVTHWYENRGDALHENSVAHLPAAVAAAVVPYRRARLA